MRIGYDAISMVGGGGNSRYATNLFAALAAIDSQTEYVPFGYVHDWARHGDVVPAYVSALGIPVPHNLLQKAQEQLFGFHLRRQHLDAFHCTNPLDVVTGMSPLIVTVHDLAPLHNPTWVKASTHEFFSHHIKRICDEAEMIIAVSHYTKGDLVATLQIPAQKITVIHEAADAQFYPDPDTGYVKEKFQLDQCVLYAGQLQERKNIAGLISAYGLLGEQIRHRYPLVLVGGSRDATFLQELQSHIHSLRIDNNVRFLGHVSDDDLRKLYSCARVFVYPSLFEGFGLPPLEAMSCGAPVITSKATSLPEVVGNAGVMCDVNSIEDFAQTLLRVISSDTECASLRQQSLVQAKSFSWRTAALETLAVYASVVV